jgi:hypothetical protein
MTRFETFADLSGSKERISSYHEAQILPVENHAKPFPSQAKAWRRKMHARAKFDHKPNDASRMPLQNVIGYGRRTPEWTPKVPVSGLSLIVWTGQPAHPPCKTQTLLQRNNLLLAKDSGRSQSPPIFICCLQQTREHYNTPPLIRPVSLKF